MIQRMGKEPIASELTRFSLPLILSGLLQQLYSWADAFIVGHVEGEGALAAIGATGTVINFYIMAITGFALGLSILFAQTFGRGDVQVIRRLLSTFVFLFGCGFLALTGVGIRLANPLLSALQTPADVFALSHAYLRIIFCGVPFLAVYNVYAAALRAIGDSKAPFWAILLSSAVNVLLDICFVALLRWGVQGAAAATVLSQILMTAFIACYAAKKHAILRFSIGRGMVDLRAAKEGLRLSAPPAVQSSLSAFGSLLLQRFMNGFGTQTVAAITTAYRVDSIILLPIINLGSGISTLVAQSHGAGDWRRIRRLLAVGVALMTGVSLLLTLLVIPTGGALIQMFGVGAEATAIGRNFFLRIACFYVVYGVAMAIRGGLEGTGDVLYSSAAALAALAVRIAASYVLSPRCGNMVIAYAEALSWGVLLLLYLARLVHRRAAFGVLKG